METATVLIIFIASLLIGLTGYSVYTAFGPGSKELRDPLMITRTKKQLAAF